MARRPPLVRLLDDLARDAARREREAQQRHGAKMREVQTVSREVTNNPVPYTYDPQPTYRKPSAATLNGELEVRIQELRTVLEAALAVDSLVTFSSLLENSEFPPFKLPVELEQIPAEPRREDFLSVVTKPTSMGKLIPGATRKYEQALNTAEAEYAKAYADFRDQAIQRETAVSQLQRQYLQQKQQFDDEKREHNYEVAEFEKAYRACDPQAISIYCNLVLERSSYPEGFPQEFRTAYLPESKELVIEYELPPLEIVPAVVGYTYVKSRDEIKEKPRKATEIKELYQDIVAAISLRTIYEMFDSDEGDYVQVVVFNGFVQTTDPATWASPHKVDAEEN